MLELVLAPAIGLFVTPKWAYAQEIFRPRLSDHFP